MDFEKFKKFRNECNPFAQKLEIVVTEVSEGYAKLEMTVKPDDVNPQGTAHGGVTYTMADISAGAACASRGYYASTINSTYNYLRASQIGDKLTSVAKERKAGKKICVYDVEITDQNDKLVGTGTFTYMVSDRKIELA